MAVLGFLILFPLVAAVLLFVVRANAARNAIVYVASAAIAVATLVLCIDNLGTEGVFFLFSSEVVEWVCTGISVLIAVVIVWFAVRYRNIWAGLLAVVQLAGSLVFDLLYAPLVSVPYGLYFDSLSLLMAFIIGIVGTGICVYALGYMKDFQDHEPEGARDRRPLFFALMFLFLSAMYVIVFSNNMVWLFTGWEVTTVCSFLLIGYTRTDEAVANAFRQIIMNLAGGIGFLVALFAAVINMQTLSLIDFLQMGVANPVVVALPCACLAFAGITKAAQMPFHTWLLGAMVAPTPTSALLHSSTMVKAGVFLLVKLAPVFYVCQVPAVMTVLVGGITFCLASFMAISQSNAKRVLAYSTIANLGLIVACAGVGTPEAVWAACFLILFHAVAKSLLFLCVGTAEHHIGSRDIEDMDLLFDRMPRLARLMMLGIMAMFIAPFGMLVSKWATLVSFVDTGQVALIILLAFGSAATFMFWAKWLGKLSGIAARQDNIEFSVHRSEWIALYVMAALIAASCVMFFWVSEAVVVPYLASVYGANAGTIGTDVLFFTGVLSAVVIIILFAGVRRTNPKVRQLPVYLSGVGVDNEERTFINSMSGTTKATAHNWYMESWFGERRIKPVGELACSILLVVCIAASYAVTAGLF